MERIAFENVIPAAFSNKRPESELWGNDFAFERGKTYLVEAASGTGKSTLCAYIYGCRHDYSGRITFDGMPAASLGGKQWRVMRTSAVSLLFQELRLFGELTAWENVKLKNDLTKHKSENEVLRMFDALGIGEKKDTPARLMSFGQKQRVAFIRALCQPFDFLLLDEPASHLDEGNAAAVAAMLADELQARGASAIVTSVGRRLVTVYDKTLSL